MLCALIFLVGFVVRRREQNAGAPIPGIAAKPLIKTGPQAQRLRHQRHFARVTARYAHPSPIAAGLFLADAAFFAQRHLEAPFGQFERRRGSYDTAADNDHIHLFRKVFVTMNAHNIGARH